MSPSTALLSFVLLLAVSTVVDAAAVGRKTGKAALAFSTKIIGNTRGALNIADAERARAATLKTGTGSSSSLGVANNRVNYVAQVGVGTPPTNYTLLVDTGSANTFVGVDRDKPYVNTSSSVDTGYYVSVTYNSGGWEGKEWNDTVTLDCDLVIKNQSVGVVSSAQGFPSGIDGILGVGPVDLTQDTVQGMSTVPTVLDNLLAQGTIGEEVLGVYFTPYVQGQGGELTFGGYDSMATRSPVTYVPLTKSYPASLYWGVDQSIKYGNETLLSSTAGVVDTASTFILVATDAFEKYQNLTGGVKDNSTGLLVITPSQYTQLKPLTFDVGDASLVLMPNAQIWPRALNTALGGSASAIYLVVADIGYTSGSGLDFINGYTLLERFYSVYDTSNQRVGFAQTEYTFSQSN